MDGRKADHGRVILSLPLRDARVTFFWIYSSRESLAISHVCIMFTDIKGSTSLYDRLGDSAAYALVREHFDVLFHRVEQNDGVIVKTIGDSVMASFKSSADGVAAALAIQAAFRDFNHERP